MRRIKQQTEKKNVEKCEFLTKGLNNIIDNIFNGDDVVQIDIDLLFHLN